jgi:type I restriction enzyme S subunit
MKAEITYQKTGIPWMKEIPSHWEIRPLRSIFRERGEKNSDNKITQVLSLLKDIGIVKYEDKGDIGNKKTDKPENHKIVRPGDLVINKMNAVIGSLGVSSYTGTVSQVYYVLILYDNACDLKYYSYLFQSRGVQKSLKTISYGIMEIRESISYTEFKNYKLPKPPLLEQISIAKYLDYQNEKITHFIQKKKAFIELLKEQRQGVINSAVTKGIDHNVKLKDSGIKWLGEIPEHWGLRRLRYCGSVQNGLNKGGEYFGKGHPFLGYGDIYNNEILPERPEGLVQSNESDQSICSVKKGDVFFTRTSETVDEIAFASTCHKTFDNATFSGFLIRFRPLEGIITPEYSTYYFRSQMLRNYFVKEMNIMTRASLSQDTLKNLWIALPPEDEQIEISKFIKTETTKIDQAIAKAEQEISLIKEYKEAMIAEAVLGKLNTEVHNKSEMENG